MSTNFGDLIKQWRDIRRFSQLGLSVETGISSRHISFIETGRSNPSRGCVLTIARALDMPKSAANEALLSAGHAPEYPTHALSDSELAPMLQAMNTILENHSPLPAVIIDEGWMILDGNKSAMHLMQFLPMRGTLSVVDAIINDDPDNPVFLNWNEIAAWTLLRLQTETTRGGQQGPLFELYTRLAGDPRLKGKDLASFSNRGPFLTIKVKVEGHALSVFTMLSEFTTAKDINISERRIELFFPADAPTKKFFEDFSL